MGQHNIKFNKKELLSKGRWVDWNMTTPKLKEDEEFEQQEKADREADDYLLEIIMNK